MELGKKVAQLNSRIIAVDSLSMSKFPVWTNFANNHSLQQTRDGTQAGMDNRGQNLLYRDGPRTRGEASGRIRMLQLATEAKATSMGLPSEKPSRPVGPVRPSAVGQATPSTSGTRPSRRQRVAESDSSDSDAELSSSSSDEVCLYSCISVF